MLTNEPSECEMTEQWKRRTEWFNKLTQKEQDDWNMGVTSRSVEQTQGAKRWKTDEEWLAEHDEKRDRYKEMLEAHESNRKLAHRIKRAEERKRKKALESEKIQKQHKMLQGPARFLLPKPQ